VLRHSSRQTDKEKKTTTDPTKTLFSRSNMPVGDNKTTKGRKDGKDQKELPEGQIIEKWGD